MQRAIPLSCSLFRSHTLFMVLSLFDLSLVLSNVFSLDSLDSLDSLVWHFDDQQMKQAKPANRVCLLGRNYFYDSNYHA